MLDLTEGEMQDEMARARAELAKLGVTLDEPLDERIYRALLELPPKLGRMCRTADLVSEVGARRQYSVNDSLARLRRQGRVLSPCRGAWVAVTP